MSTGSLRRAAILIASLDTECADALLDEMTPEQAASVRNAVMELGDIDLVEQQEIIERFVSNNAPAPPQADPGVEIDAALAAKFEVANVPEAFDHTDETTPSQPATRPFAFLDDVEAGDLARVLAGEHPQTAAIVAAHLLPARAAEVLGHLPREQQTEVLMRIARLSPPHPDVIRDLEQEMQSLLANQQQREQVGAVGLATVEAILQNTAAAARQELVADLTKQDQILVRQLRIPAPHNSSETIPHAAPVSHNPVSHNPVSHNPVSSTSFDAAPRSGPPGEMHPNPDPYRSEERFAAPRAHLEFSDLESLESAALAQILHRCSANTTLLALAGASHQFVQQIMAQLPGREATQLERKIQQIGPLRLDDVQRAQQQVAEIAQQLIDEGSLVVPGKPRLSVAA